METQNNELQLSAQQPKDITFGNSENFEHAQRVAKMLSSSNLIPVQYQNNIANTMIALEMANRIGASPIMVMQNLYIVKGMPGWSSSFVIASLNTCGRFSPLRFEISGSGETLACHAWAIDKKTNEKITGTTITWAMVKAEGWLDKVGSKWKTMPEQMIQYRAGAFFGRLYAPDILMGMQTVEEVMDFVITPEDEKKIKEETGKRAQDSLVEMLMNKDERKK